MTDKLFRCAADLGLTDREFDVLLMLSEGHSNKVLAHRLKITESTVKAHISQIIRLVGCKNRTQAALLGFCIERNLMDHVSQLMDRLSFVPRARRAALVRRRPPSRAAVQPSSPAS